MDITGRQVVSTIGDTLMSYVPSDKFMQTDDPSEADAVLFLCQASASHDGMYTQITNHTLENNAEVLGISRALHEKTRIIYVDFCGPDVPDNSMSTDKFDSIIRENDIPITPSSCLYHKNAQQFVPVVDDTIFKINHSVKRKPSSVIMSGDHFYNHFDQILQIIPHVSDMFITGMIEMEDSYRQFLGEKSKKIQYAALIYPIGVRSKLSQYQYILNMKTDVGMELMGVEGGFCGAQPIYPDTPYYQDMFSGTDVKLFDAQNPIESIIDIVTQKSTWDTDSIEPFVKKYGASKNLYTFWNNVYDILESNASQ